MLNVVQVGLYLITRILIKLSQLDLLNISEAEIQNKIESML